MMIVNSDREKYEVRSLKYERAYFVRRTSYLLAASVTAAATVWLSAQQPGSPSPSLIRGFSAASSAAQAARERELKALPSAKAAEADFDVMTAEPHHTGSPYEI